MLLKIVGLNSDKFFYQVKECGAIGWKQYTKPIDVFIKMMFILFPELKKQSMNVSFITDKIKGKAHIFFLHR